MNQELQRLSAEVQEILHPHSSEDARLVQKGLMLYRQGMVTHLQFGDDGVTATVQDVTPVKVRLDLNFLSMSECSCPNEGWCRHQMAVFFAAYAKGASVTEWVEEWREPMKEKKLTASWGMQTAKDLIKANGILKPDYGRWVHSFEVSFDTLVASKKYTSPFIIAELFDIYERRISASAPVEQEWRLLYELVGLVVSFKKLAVLSEQSGHTEQLVTRAYLHLFHNMMDEAGDLLDRIGMQTMPFDFDDFIVKLKDDAFELLTAAQGLEMERTYLYRLLWIDLFKKKEWRLEEIRKVEARLEKLMDWENPLPLMIAAVHLNLLATNDDAALKMLGNVADERITPYLMSWIELLSQKKAWKRVAPLVELFVHKIKRFLENMGSYQSCSSFTRAALKAIAPYCAGTNRMDLFERAMMQTLPYSFADYEYLLFERGQYDRWGELHEYVGLSYYELPKDRVKVVEKEMPEVLMGMLHQLAQREIEQKNRQSYKHAIRHLKKLRTLYKKLKRLDDWDYFFEQLLERTKRLRAFHEECRRSKLIEV